MRKVIAALACLVALVVAAPGMALIQPNPNVGAYGVIKPNPIREYGTARPMPGPKTYSTSRTQQHPRTFSAPSSSYLDRHK
jgi:hypothetical protein